jgi:hypothetical protein
MCVAAQVIVYDERAAGVDPRGILRESLAVWYNIPTIAGV